MFLYNKEIFNRCFCYSKTHWYLNLKNIPLYFENLHKLIKYGYDPYAHWECYDWFIRTMKPILTRYLESEGVPIVIKNFPSIIQTEEDKELEKQNSEEWNRIINRMIELLDLMDDNNEKYLTEDYIKYPLKGDTEREIAKNEFFKLFSEYFYYLWD